MKQRKRLELSGLREYRKSLKQKVERDLKDSDYFFEPHTKAEVEKKINHLFEKAFERSDYSIVKGKYLIE